jgi:hypothetical protein
MHVQDASKGNEASVQQLVALITEMIGTGASLEVSDKHSVNLTLLVSCSILICCLYDTCNSANNVGLCFYVFKLIELPAVQ